MWVHPTPSQNVCVDRPDDQEEAASGPRTDAGRDGRELFACRDRLGSQLAGSVLAGASPNWILIMPFMTTGFGLPAGPERLQ